ncbi:hypothetical protein AB0E01_44885 [Nocardia vinacea]|uniref:hypothetical protein n=1 Tax=Nocardia vinacea TaxID=96468 RepID=UPI0033BFE2FF
MRQPGFDVDSGAVGDLDFVGEDRPPRVGEDAGLQACDQRSPLVGGQVDIAEGVGDPCVEQFLVFAFQLRVAGGSGGAWIAVVDVQGGPPHGQISE